EELGLEPAGDAFLRDGHVEEVPREGGAGRAEEGRRGRVLDGLGEYLEEPPGRDPRDDGGGADLLVRGAEAEPAHGLAFEEDAVGRDARADVAAVGLDAIDDGPAEPALAALDADGALERALVGESETEAGGRRDAARVEGGDELERLDEERLPPELVGGVEVERNAAEGRGALELAERARRAEAAALERPAVIDVGVEGLVREATTALEGCHRSPRLGELVRDGARA